MPVTQDICWTEYPNYEKNSSFDGGEFIRKNKDIGDGNSHLCHQKYSPYCTKVLGFVPSRVKSMVLVIGAEERSWADVKTIKFGKISDIVSDVSEK